MCQFTLVPCPKECKDDNGIQKIMRRDLQQHLMEECPNRDYSCEHCDLKETYATTECKPNWSVKQTGDMCDRVERHGAEECSQS